MQTVLKDNIQNISALCKLHHVKKLYAFGSVLRNDYNKQSDVDFLYEMDYSGFDFSNLSKMPFDPFLEVFDLKEELEQLLGTKVDLVPNQNFKNKILKDSIEKDKTLIYAAA